jgi:dTDP-4-dehydrorhamnose 3,5-epimerase-like enzyme
MTTDITNVQIRNFKEFWDETGCLTPIEFGDLPFPPARIFCVTDVPKGCLRGDHAHYVTRQLVICVKGLIEVNLFNGEVHRSLVLEERCGVLIDAMVWDSQRFLQDGSVLLALCSTPYNKDDYIIDKEQFMQLSKKQRDT